MRFSKVVALTLFSILSLVAFSLRAADAWVAGEHYEELQVPVQTADANSIEVVEVFSYSCVHCFSFDPSLEGWRAAVPGDVKFLRMPAIFNQDWQLLAQAYFTAEVLDVVEKVHSPIFNAIHVENSDLRNPTLMAEIFEKQGGVKPEQFNEVYNSFSVRNRVNQAVAKGRAYRITGVPTLIVNGKYRVDGQMAGNNTRMLEVVDFLIAKERTAKANNAKAVTH